MNNDDNYPVNRLLKVISIVSVPIIAVYFNYFVLPDWQHVVNVIDKYLVPYLINIWITCVFLYLVILLINSVLGLILGEYCLLYLLLGTFNRILLLAILYSSLSLFILVAFRTACVVMVIIHILLRVYVV